MKGFLKGCAIVALILVVIGGAMAVIAGSLVGKSTLQDTVSEVTGDKLDVKFGFPFGISIESNGQNKDSDRDLSDDLKVFDFDEDDHHVLFESGLDILSGDVKQFSLDEKPDALEVQVGGCSFKVEESEDDKVWLEAHNMGKFQGYVKNGTLFVKSSNKLNVGAGDFSKDKIILYLPKDFAFDKVNLDLGAGEVDFDDIKAKQVSMQVGAGQITCKNLEADKVDLNVGLGEIRIKDMKVNNVIGTVGMGNLDLDGEVLVSADLNCSMGNIDLKVEGKEEDYNYEIKSSMGNVDIGHESFSGVASKKSIDNGADRDIIVECSMGKASVSIK